jgi:hypothetical protein
MAGSHRSDGEGFCHCRKSVFPGIVPSRSGASEQRIIPRQCRLSIYFGIPRMEDDDSRTWFWGRRRGQKTPKRNSVKGRIPGKRLRSNRWVGGCKWENDCKAIGGPVGGKDWGSERTALSGTELQIGMLGDCQRKILAPLFVQHPPGGQVRQRCFQLFRTASFGFEAYSHLIQALR